MSDILNYQFADPMQTFLQMSQMGALLQQQRAAGSNAAAAAEEAQARLRLAQVQAEAGAARQAQLDKLMERLKQPNVTYQDYLQLSMLLPKEQADAMREAAKLLNADQQQAALTETSQIFSAFKGGRTDLAVQLIRRQAEAERAAGNEQGAMLADEWAKMAEESEDGAEAVMNMFGYQIAQMPGGDTAIAAAIKMDAERRAQVEFPTLMAQKRAELAKAESEAEKASIELKYADQLKDLEVKQAAATLGLTDAQMKQALANADKLSAETQRLLLEDQAKKDEGEAISTEKRYTMEKQLRDEYVKRSGQFTELRSSYETIKASGEAAYEDTTGAADVAMITAFMKMLDPGSVVRETEFANAENTAGLFNTLKNLLPKIGQGKKLGDAQRKNFLGLAAKYMEAAAGFEKELRSDLTKVATDYGLSTDRVFGTSRAQAGFGTVEPAHLGEGGTGAASTTEEVDY